MGIYYLILMLAVADRIRGDRFQPWIMEFNHRLAAYIVLGWTFAALTGHVWDILTLPIAAMLVLGASSGLSEPIGAYLSNREMNEKDYEWWQVGWLKKSPVLAMTFRGGMWGLPVFTLGYFDSALLWALPAYLIAFPLAAILAKQIPGKTAGEQWEYMEFLRGGLAGSLFVYFNSLGLL